MPDHRERLKVFFSSSFADQDARRLREALAEYFDITSADTLVGSFARHTALSNALRDVDVVVVAVPPPEDPASRNVFVEVGAALGAQRPVVLVGERAHVPSDLADLPVFQSESASGLASDIELVATGGFTAHPGSGDTTRAHLGLLPVVLSDLRRHASTPGKVEAEAVSVVDDIFRAAGARTKNALVIGNRVTDAPDLAVWHDDLTATLGTPLPVEILMRGSAWPAIRKRLERTLVLSGGRTLVAIYLGPPTDAPRKWSDGRRSILVVAALQLLDELSRAGLGVALTRLLDRAEL